MAGNCYPIPVFLRELAIVARISTTKIRSLVFMCAFIPFFDSVEAHDWYTGIRNPTSGVGCCGGRDCVAIKLDELGRLSEDAEYYILDGKWRFPKADAMPAREIKEGESGYAYCIWGGKPRCFFHPTNA